MRVLLDTHVWLWMWGEPERLRDEARTIVEDPATELNVSAVSAWEIAAKHAAGRLRLPSSPEAWLTDPRHRRECPSCPLRSSTPSGPALCRITIAIHSIECSSPRLRSNAWCCCRLTGNWLRTKWRPSEPDASRP